MTQFPLTARGEFVDAGHMAQKAWQRLRSRMADFTAAQTELHERMMLMNRPWEEDLLHWAYEDGRWQLHGELLPPPGRRYSVTRRGWCLGRSQ